MFLFGIMFLLSPSVVVLSLEVQCVKYDISAGTGHQGMENCSERVEKDGVPNDLCFTVWQNRRDPSSSHSSGLTVFMQGCIASYGLRLPTYEACRQEGCVETAGVKANDNRMLFCCCNTTSCNQKFDWKPKETIQTVQTTTIDPENLQDHQKKNKPNSHPSSGDNLVIYLLGSVGLVSIICILLLVGCLAVVNKKQKFEKEDITNLNRTKMFLPISEGQTLEEKEKAQEKLEALLSV
jgi:hypothetical protein